MAASGDTYSVVYNFKLAASETLELDVDLASDPTVLHESTDIKGTLTASTVPPIEQFWESTETITEGTPTELDLENLARANLPDIDFSTMKVNLVKLVASATNTAGEYITIEDGTANAYFLFGGVAGGKVFLYPGDCYCMYAVETRPVVDATHSDVKISYSEAVAATATLEIMLGAGVT